MFRAAQLATGVVEIAAADGSARAEVWPHRGFNCLRWQIHGGDVLDVAPDWDANPVPTRSGHPVLFPFPNRVAAGRFDWHGKAYRVPLNDSTKANAIHGFTPYRPWQVQGLDEGVDSAAATGEFLLSRDAPECLGQWPGDIRLLLTYRLSRNALRVEARVENPGAGPVPWALGYHPYFRPPADADSRADRWEVQTAARAEWVVEGGVPTGARRPPAPELDFTERKLLGPTALDHLFGDLDAPVEADGLRTLATLRAGSGELRIRADDHFTELVLFTPVHRRSLAVEAYSAPTNAVHLAERGQASGWRELPPGGSARAVVEYSWHA